MCYSWLGVSVLQHQHYCHFPLKRLAANDCSCRASSAFPCSPDRHRALIRCPQNLSPSLSPQMAPNSPKWEVGAGWQGSVEGGSAGWAQQSGCVENKLWSCWTPEERHSFFYASSTRRIVVWLSIDLDLVSCGFCILCCHSSSVTAWDPSFCSHHLDDWPVEGMMFRKQFQLTIMLTSKMWWTGCSEGSLENTPRLGPCLLEVPLFPLCGGNSSCGDPTYKSYLSWKSHRYLK